MQVAVAEAVPDPGAEAVVQVVAAEADSAAQPAAVLPETDLELLVHLKRVDLRKPFALRDFEIVVVVDYPET